MLMAESTLELQSDAMSFTSACWNIYYTHFQYEVLVINKHSLSYLKLLVEEMGCKDSECLHLPKDRDRW